jgi:predicted nucleic acid-binding protein
MLFLDTSALLKRYVDEDGTGIIVAAMAGDHVWMASALAGAETEVAIARLPVADDERARQLRRYEEDWEHFRIVPVDAECVGVAAHIATEQGIRIVDAIHLAAAMRLPRPFRFLTFDPDQADAARALGFDVRGVGS